VFLAYGISSAGHLLAPTVSEANREGWPTINIPTAEYRNFRNYRAAKKYLHSVNHNVVFKASGLAAGKGVIIAETQEEVLAALKELMVDRAPGDAGNEVVIEGFLDGQGISILTISDRVTFKSMPLPRTTREFLMATKDQIRLCCKRSTETFSSQPSAAYDRKVRWSFKLKSSCS